MQADADNSGVGFDVASATSVYHVGILRQTIASTDSDYASSTRLALEVDLMGLYDAVVGTGTPTANYEGLICDLKSDGTIDVNATTIKVFLIHHYIGSIASVHHVAGFITRWAYVNCKQ